MIGQTLKILCMKQLLIRYFCLLKARYIICRLISYGVICSGVGVWWCGDRNLCYSMPHGIKVLKTGTVISRGGYFTSSFRLLLAKRSQQALKYRGFLSCLTDKNWPKAPPEVLPALRHTPRVEEV